MFRLVIVLLALAGFPKTNSAPRDNFDIPDVYSAVLPKYDLNSLKEDLPNHPAIASITTNLHNSMKLGTQQTNKSDAGAETSGMDETLLEAIRELEVLQKLLEEETQYFENRKKEDKLWPNTLISKVQLQLASVDEKRLLNEDLERVVSSVVIMRMMEQRLFFLNENVQQTIAAHPNTDINTLFGINDNVPVVLDLFEFKYLEGLLHSVNGMLEDSVKEAAMDSSFFNPFVIPGGAVQPLLPGTDVKDDDDDSVTIATFIVLLFTAIGFFFVIFLVVYMLLKAVRKLFETNAAFDKRSKYEQI